MLRFTIFYIFNMFVFFLIFNYQQTIDLHSMYTNILNPIVTFFVNGIGIEAFMSGIDIILPTSILKILFGCNGLEAILIFTAGVLAYQSDLGYKLKYLLKGILLISVINVLRLVLLAYVIEVHNSYFTLMHDYVTQHMMVFFSIILFLIFTSNVKTINKGNL